MRIGPRVSSSCLAVALAAALVVPRGAFAADAPPEAEEEGRLQEAERACLTGNYQRGVEILTELYLGSRHPAYLHNQARCYEQNGQYRLAAGRYREFLRKLQELPPEAVTSETKLSADRVAAIEAHASKLELLGAAPDAPNAPGERTRAASPQPTPAPPARPLEVREAAPPTGGGGWRGAGIALLTVGGLALAGSTAAGLMARQAEQNISNASMRGGATFDASEYDGGARAARLATVGFIAAPAAVVLGALLYWKGAAARRSESRASVRLLPALARAGVGALLIATY